MKNKGLNNYLLRLNRSSFPEVCYRIKLAMQAYLIKYRKDKNNFLKIPEIDFDKFRNIKLPEIIGQKEKSIADEILRGVTFYRHIEDEFLQMFGNGQRARYFYDIKYLDQEFDIRIVWEPARLQHITLLLHSIQKDHHYYGFYLIKQFAKDAVLKWIRENPFLLGPHYISAMECGLRIPVFFFALKLLDNLNKNEFEQILDAIYYHAWWISKRLSLYSSLGNHTVAECTGLAFAGAIFREQKIGGQWLEKGFCLLQRELEHQILKDGGSAEQSLDYHRFILDLYWLSVDFLEKNNLKDCSHFKPILKRGEEFLNAFLVDHDIKPSIGDSDSGYAVARGLYPKRGDIRCKESIEKFFSNAGYSIIREDSICLFFDHGPLGMAPLFNHGHADALSILLFKEKKAFFIDPGTYRYNGVPKWRRYFKGTRAHNTVMIDGQDQALQETGFIWSHPYNAELIRKENVNGIRFIQATHDGYLRLKKPVRHIRSIFIIAGKKVIIRDTFSGEGIHEFELNFHLHPDVEISRKHEKWWILKNGDTEIYITIFSQDNFRVIKGQKDPIVGWFSHSYGLKCETSVLNISITETPEELTFMTGIGIDTPFDLQDIIERLGEIE